MHKHLASQPQIYMKPVAVNRKAKFEYHISDKFEAGISLLGSEVKSIREGRINLKDSFVRVVGKELFLFNCHITPYSKIQGHVDIDPTRNRKLLMHRREIDKIVGLVARKGHTCIPLSVYFKRGKAKVEIGIGRGKKEIDKREGIKRRIHNREAQAAIKKHKG